MINKAANRTLKMSGNYLLVALVALSLLMAGCRPKPTPTQSPEAPPPTESSPTQAPPVVTTAPEEQPAPAEVPTELVGLEWVLVAYGDVANPVVVEPNTRPTAIFGADGTLSGSGGCNNFTSAFQIEGEKISFGPAASTMMACEIGMDQETAYLAALEKAQSFQVVGGNRLLINYEGGTGSSAQLVYDAQTPLVGTLWVLTDYGDPNNPTPSQPGVATTAIFSADGALSGSAGCNSYNTSYTTQDGQIKVGLPTSTMMACDTGMEQEQAYLSALEMAESYNLAGPYLEITYANGAARLRFSAQHMPLENDRWVLSAIDGRPLPAGVEAHIIFTPGKEVQENQVNGNAGCNGFFGAYTVEGDTLSVPGPFGATQMMCPEEAMQVERDFLAALEKAQSYATVLKQLTITTSNGTLVFFADRAPLEGPIWKLTSLGPVDNPQPPVAGADFNASFSRQAGMPSGVMKGTTGCNNTTNTYYANWNEIKFNPVARSDEVCPPALADQMVTYFEGLNKARGYRILGNELQIFYDDQVFKYIATYPPSQGEVGPLAQLNGTKWWLYSIGATPAVPVSETTAQFTINPDGLTGQISGSAGCNNYNAQITGVFTVGPASATQSICDTPPGIMKQESAYLAALSAAQSFSLEGGRLLINTGQGVLVFTKQGPSAVQPLPPTETPSAVQPLPPTETPEAVQPLPTPTAVINAPNAGQAGQTITFDGSGSTAGAAPLTSYQWNFGDGSTGEGVVVDHAFAQPGVYTVTLTVTDENGQTDNATLEVTIS